MRCRRSASSCGAARSRSCRRCRPRCPPTGTHGQGVGVDARRMGEDAGRPRVTRATLCITSPLPPPSHPEHVPLPSQVLREECLAVGGGRDAAPTARQVSLASKLTPVAMIGQSAVCRDGQRALATALLQHKAEVSKHREWLFAAMDSVAKQREEGVYKVAEEGASSAVSRGEAAERSRRRASVVDKERQALSEHQSALQAMKARQSASVSRSPAPRGHRQAERGGDGNGGQAAGSAQLSLAQLTAHEASAVHESSASSTSRRPSCFALASRLHPAPPTTTPRQPRRPCRPAAAARTQRSHTATATAASCRLQPQAPPRRAPPMWSTLALVPTTRRLRSTSSREPTPEPS